MQIQPSVQIAIFGLLWKQLSRGQAAFRMGSPGLTERPQFLRDASPQALDWFSGLLNAEDGFEYRGPLLSVADVVHQPTFCSTRAHHDDPNAAVGGLPDSDGGGSGGSGATDDEHSRQHLKKSFFLIP